MRFLIDNALSPQVADGLVARGHDAVHVRHRGLASAPDVEIFALAAAEDRIIVSADTDFGMLLALSQTTKPSVLLLRGDASREPQRQVAMIDANLPTVSDALVAGSVVVLDGRRVRIRALPIGG